MALFDNLPALQGLGEVDWFGFAGGLFQIITALVMFFVVGGATYWFFLRKGKNVDNKRTIYWFEETNGRMVRIGKDDALELIIPTTNIPVFYIKARDMYLPKLVRKMGDNEYWCALRTNGEIVNFTMKNINDQMRESNLDFDHTDMRYAHTNLRELIKRNYKDKAVKWWVEYKEVISLVILIFVMTLSFIFIVSKVGALIDKAGILLDRADIILKTTQASTGSGVVSV